MKNKKSKAFTLVELLIVIAIIGVLASLIYPALSRAMGAGSRVKSMNNAKNISQTWLTYVNTGTGIVVGKTVYDWAAVLADKAGLNTPGIWILDFDTPVREKVGEGAIMPISIINKTGSRSTINPEFKNFPISWEVANRTLPDAPTGTPLVWSRGLKTNGRWDKETGVFRDEGGHIGFTDGSVEWKNSLVDENSNTGVLKIYDGDRRTSNIAQAIRGGSANILRSDVGSAAAEE